jgi:hypothetical protein
MIALIFAWFSTRNMERVYDANTTIYTGMITGYNIEGGSGIAGGNAQTNMQNLMLIITTDNTIHEVSLRLFARCMIYGNPHKDNNYISAEHFRQLDATVPADVKALINHNSEDATYSNLKAYEKPSQDNYLFGLLAANTGASGIIKIVPFSDIWYFVALGVLALSFLTCYIGSKISLSKHIKV